MQPVIKIKKMKILIRMLLRHRNNSKNNYKTTSKTKEEKRLLLKRSLKIMCVLQSSLAHRSNNLSNKSKYPNLSHRLLEKWHTPQRLFQKYST